MNVNPANTDIIKLKVAAIAKYCYSIVYNIYSKDLKKVKNK